MEIGYHNLFIVLVTITTIASFINYRYFKIPKTIFLTISSILLSITVTIMAKLFPGNFKTIYAVLSGINFRTTILDVMLGYLIFASSLRIDSLNLKKEFNHVAYLASIGVFLSTAICGTVVWLIINNLTHFHLGYIECLIFGAIISPTDAVAVSAVFKSNPSVPHNIQTRVAGEALFNDAFGILLLVSLLQIADTSINFSIIQIIISFFREVIGAVVWGYLVGIGICAILKRINDSELTILTTITAAGLGYVIAQVLDVSPIITMAIAGIYVGNRRKDNHFSELTSFTLTGFWELADDILNAFVFILIGLELLTIYFTVPTVVIGFISFLVIFIARYISISLPEISLKLIRKKSQSSNKERILISWIGVRGGISIALAWSIFNLSPTILSLTYVVVVSSILLQGSTLQIVTRKLFCSKTTK